MPYQHGLCVVQENEYTTIFSKYLFMMFKCHKFYFRHLFTFGPNIINFSVENFFGI